MHRIKILITKIVSIWSLKIILRLWRGIIKVQIKIGLNCFKDNREIKWIKERRFYIFIKSSRLNWVKFQM